MHGHVHFDPVLSEAVFIFFDLDGVSLLAVLGEFPIECDQVFLGLELYFEFPLLGNGGLEGMPGLFLLNKFIAGLACVLFFMNDR